MRYNSRVQFQIESNGLYNTQTSKYDILIVDIKDVKPCSINPLSVQQTALEFGNVDRDISVLRIQGKLNEQVTHCIVSNRRYRIVKSVIYDHDSAFYVEEIA